MSDFKTKIERIFSDDTFVLEPSAPPAERLASLLSKLGPDREALTPCLALLGDGLTAALVYQTQPGLVMSRLERSLEMLSSEQRFELLTKALEMRPIRNEDVVRWVAFSLEALGLREGRAEAVRDGWSMAQKAIVYRWSEVLRNVTVLQTPEVTKQLDLRGIEGEGASPWQVFHKWLGFRASILVTPRQSPSVRRIVEEQMQRSDWLDMPWLLGTPDGTFTLEETEDDSSPKNMSDGERIKDLLITQRLPSSDFSVATYGWLPRQTMETALPAAEESGITVLDAGAFDLQPTLAEPHQLGREARRLQAETVRLLATYADGELPPDLTLVFHRDEDTEHGALELKVASTFKKDGQKTLVRLRLGHPEPILRVLQAHTSQLGPVTLPILLARLHSLCPRILVAPPSGGAFEVSSEQVAAWDPSAGRVRPEHAALALAAPSTAILGPWRGTYTQMHFEDVQPFFIALEEHDRSLRGVVTLASGEQFGTVGDLHGSRLSMRQETTGGQGFTVDLAWSEADRKLTGLWRQGTSGGTVTLEQEAPTSERPSPEALLLEVTRSWATEIELDLEAVRFPGELDTLRALFADDLFADEYVRAARNRALRTEAIELESMVGRGVTELSAAMIPSVFRALDAATAALGFKGKVRLWVHNDASLNGFVTVDRREIIVHFTSGILEVFEEPELRAVIGHELGHAVLGSHELALRMQQTQLSGAARMRYFTLRRYQELSADRLALIASGDPKAVLRAQTMLRTGIRKRDLFGAADTLIANARAEIDVLKARTDRRGALDSHPYGSLRIVALDLFAQSGRFGAGGGRGASEPRIQAELAELGRLLEAPAVFDEASAPPNAIPRFRALASLQLVEMDNTISAKEVWTMMKLEGLAEELHQTLAWSHERRHVEMLALSRHVKRSLSVPEREAMLMDLLRVVRADNVVQYAETNALGELSWLLEVDTLSFRKTLEDLYRSAS